MKSLTAFRLCGAEARRVARIALLSTAVSSLSTLTAPAWADDGPFRLNSRQLDRITASGTGDTADAVAVASGFGSGQTYTDTLTDTSVDPNGGSAEAFGVATGPDGSYVTTTILVDGQSETQAVTLSSSGDVVGQDGSVVVAASGGSLNYGETGITAGTDASTSGGDGLTIASTDFQSVNGDDIVGGAATADALSLDGTSAASNELGYQTNTAGYNLKLQADGTGNTDGSAFSGTGAVLNEGDVMVTLSSDGGAIGSTSSASSVQSAKIAGNHMIVRTTGTGHTSDAGGAISGSAISIDGISQDSYRLLERTIPTRYMSRSMSIAIIDLR